MARGSLHRNPSLTFSSQYLSARICVRLHKRKSSLTESGVGMLIQMSRLTLVHVGWFTLVHVGECKLLSKFASTFGDIAGRYCWPT